MRFRCVLVMSLVLLAGSIAPSHAQTQTAPAAGSLAQDITSLAALDYPVRMHAARLIRRRPGSEAVPALVEAVRRDSNEFVRYRALVLLTAFNDPGTPNLMSDLVRDRNDRVREVVYKWFEQHPNPQMAAPLLGLLQTEQAEFVRPALIAALAALDTDAVRRAMVAEITRGLDLFRSAVIESLGRHQAVYALDALVDASRIDSPLQDDAVLALGRIGGPRAAAAVSALASGGPEATLMVHAARCLMGESCREQLAALVAIAEAADARASQVRVAIDALSAVAQGRSAPAVSALMGLAVRRSSVRERVAVAIAAAALRQPDWIVAWLDTTDQTTRESVLPALKNGFDRLEEEFAEEQFFASVRANYWRASEGSTMRALTALLIQRLEF